MPYDPNYNDLTFYKTHKTKALRSVERAMTFVPKPFIPPPTMDLTPPPPPPIKPSIQSLSIDGYDMDQYVVQVQYEGGSGILSRNGSIPQSIESETGAIWFEPQEDGQTYEYRLIVRAPNGTQDITSFFLTIGNSVIPPVVKVPISVSVRWLYFGGEGGGEGV